MRAECPHAIDPAERCPAACLYAKCDRSTHRVTGDPALVLNPAVDFGAARKEECLMCAFFLEHGPRLG
jgi:hypothetical protein